MKRGAILIVFFILALMLFLNGCAGPAPPSKDRVVIYVSTDRVFSEPILRAYEQKAGAAVQVV